MYVVLSTMLARRECSGSGVTELLADLLVEGKFSASHDIKHNI